MISSLKGWSAKISSPSSKRVLVADEGLVLLDDGPHFRVDPLEVVVAEVGPVRQLEVVVEAVLDHRADGVLGPGPQPPHRLGHDVGGRVPQHLTPGLGVAGDDRHLVAVVQLASTGRPRARRRPRPRRPWPGGTRWRQPTRRPSCPRPAPAVEPSGRPTEMTPAIVHPSLFSRRQESPWSGHRCGASRVQDRPGGPGPRPVPGGGRPPGSPAQNAMSSA